MTAEHEDDFTLEEQFEGDVSNLQMAWRELGIDSDSFLKCSRCHKFMPLLVEGLGVPEDELCTCRGGELDVVVLFSASWLVKRW